MNLKPKLDLLDELRTIALTGKNYTRDPYDLERYNRILELVSMSYSEITALPSEAIKEGFIRELGYITPKVGVQGALFNESGQILLEKRADDELWGLPSGWVEAGEAPEAAIKREMLEEANLEVEPVKLLGLYTRLPGQFSQPHASIHVLYLCRYKNGVLQKSFESLEMQFCDYQTINEWHKDHKQQVEDALKYYRKPNFDTL